MFILIFGEQQIFILDCVGGKKMTLQNNVYIPNCFDYNWSIKSIIKCTFEYRPHSFKTGVLNVISSR